METFQDLWYKINELPKEIRLLGHKFEAYHLKLKEANVLYICYNCKTGLKRVERTLMHERHIFILNVSNGKFNGDNFSLPQSLKNLLTCDEITIKSIIE